MGQLRKENKMKLTWLLSDSSELDCWYWPAAVPLAARHASDPICLRYQIIFAVEEIYFVGEARMKDGFLWTSHSESDFFTWTRESEKVRNMTSEFIFVNILISNYTNG